MSPRRCIFPDKLYTPSEKTVGIYRQILRRNYLCRYLYRRNLFVDNSVGFLRFSSSILIRISI
jgi:hypothetical protein